MALLENLNALSNLKTGGIRKKIFSCMQKMPRPKVLIKTSLPELTILQRILEFGAGRRSLYRKN
jgi:hypothetical protein